MIAGAVVGSVVGVVLLVVGIILLLIVIKRRRRDNIRKFGEDLPLGTFITCFFLPSSVLSDINSVYLLFPLLASTT